MDDTLKPIAQSLRPLIGSSSGCAVSTTLSARTDAETAVQRARLLAGCYRKDDAADPETYAGAVAAVLAEFPPDIVRRVTDPRTGLPSRSQWLPTVKEVHDACSELDQRERGIAAAAVREEEQLRMRREWLASQPKKPTLEELKAKYGPNWGMSQDARDKVAAARHAAFMRQANDTLLRREYASAGETPREAAPGMPISRELVSMVQKADAELYEARMRHAKELGAEADRLAARKAAE